MSLTARIIHSLAVGFAVGGISGLMGVGGGVLMVPALVHIFGLSQHKAHGTSLVIMVTLAVLAGASYYIHHAVNWTIAVSLIPGGIIGANLGARIAQKISGVWLKRLFAGFVVVTGIRMLWAGMDANFNGLHANLAGLDAALAGAVTGALAGLLSGMLGVGGGIILIPAMALIHGLNQHLAQGTSLIAIIPTASSGACIHYKLGNVDLKAAAGLGTGAIPGVLAGSAAAHSLSSSSLQVFFGCFLIAIAVLLFIQSRAGKNHLLPLDH